MDVNLDILILATVSHFHKINKFYRLDENDEEFIRALVSFIVGELIEEAKFSAQISGLIERGYLIRDGKCFVTTASGQALVDTLSPVRLHSDDVDFIDQCVSKYMRGGRNKEVVESLIKDAEKKMEYIGKKIEDIPGSKLLSNSFLGTIEFHFPNFFRLKFRMRALAGARDSSSRYRILGPIERSIEKDTKLPIIINIGSGDTFYLISPIKEIKIKHDGQTLEPIGVTEIDASSQEVPLKRIVEKVVETRIKEGGYQSAGRGYKFVNYNERYFQRTRIGRVREFPAFRGKVEITKPPEFIVWVEPYRRVMYTVFDFIEYRRAEGKNNDEIKKELSQLVIRVLPRNTKAKVVDIEFDKNIETEKVPNRNETYYSFWKREHHIELGEMRQPMIEVTFEVSDQPFCYPSEVVYIDKRDLEKEVGTYQDRQPRVLSPPERIEKINELINLIFEDKTIKVREYMTIRVHDVLPSWGKLKDIGYCKRIVKIQPPILEFANGVTSSDPRTVFTAGPYSGGKDVFLSYVFAPIDLDENEIYEMVNGLRSVYERFRFGKFSMPTPHLISKFSTTIGEVLDNIIQKTPSYEVDNQIAIAIQPKGGGLYYDFKKLVPYRKKIPIQMMRQSTVYTITKGRYDVLKHLAIQIYTKLLKKHEAVWILRNPADTKLQSMYVGIGFSMEPYEGKQSKCSVSLCDAKGRELNWRTFSTPFISRYITKEWFTAVLENVKKDIKKSVHKRMVFYRTGDTYESEVIAIKAGFRTEGFDSKFDLVFISVLGGIRRIFTENNEYGNPDVGISIIVNDNEAILSTSALQEVEVPQGTVVPVCIIQNIGDNKIEEIIQEYHDLTYLNWSAPTTTSKHPIVLNIANNMADLIKELKTDTLISYLQM